MITNITIKNIKGYGDPATSIDLELKTNKVNMLYAPNGSGKSSLAIAFASLLPRSLKVDKENMYHKDEALEPELKVTLDDEVLTANRQKNEITPKLACCVINSGVIPGATQHNMGRGFTSVSGFLDVEDIELYSNIPENVTPNYRITEIRKHFGKNGKVLPTLEVFQNKGFLFYVEKAGPLLTSFPQAKSRKALIEDIVSKINALKGTAESITSAISDDWFTDLESNTIYSQIIAEVGKYAEATPFSRFALFYELLYFWDKAKTEVRKANVRTEYERFKSYVDWNISLLDTTWKQVHTVETEGKLVLPLPRADEISNGQRDHLTFTAELLKFRASLKDGKPQLLIIDEVFDYLDDANVIAAQCFLTNMLKAWKGNVYLCVLTHLNPYTFKNYIFSDDKVNHLYLFNTKPQATPEMKAFISFREGLDRSDAIQDDLYHRLSHDLFHYNPIRVDYSTDIASFKRNQHLKQTWGRTEVLHGVLIDEVNKYLSGLDEYDPYAVAMAVRLRIEKIMYETLPTQALKDGMVNECMTKNKMKYCADNGFEMPEVFNIANAIHNDADHLKFDAEQNKYIERPMVYKLQNHSIHTMISHLFEWEGTLITTAIID